MLLQNVAIKSVMNATLTKSSAIGDGTEQVDTRPPDFVSEFNHTAGGTSCISLGSAKF